MHHAIADELGVFETWDHGEDAFLLAPFQVGLEANQVVQCTGSVVLTQLYDRVRQLPGMRVHETNRLHRPEQRGLLAAAHHDFNRHAAFKVYFFLEVLQLRHFCVNQCFVEGVEFLFGHRAIEVSRFAFVIP
ncbi:hypothetical protein D3C81_1086230 [compost metagenome]